MENKYTIRPEPIISVPRIERQINEVTLMLDKLPMHLAELTIEHEPPVLFGSLGRRVAFAIAEHGIKTISQFQDLSYGVPNMPRSKRRGVYDLDIAIPEGVIPWSEFAEFAANESNKLPHVYVDPHFLKVTTLDGVKFMIPQNGYGENVPIFLSCDKVFTSSGFDWQIPDLWTHLAITAAYASVRVSDIPEITRLVEYIIKLAPREHPNKDVVKFYLSKYVANLGPVLDASRAIYSTLFSEDLRNAVQIRNRLTHGRLRESSLQLSKNASSLFLD